MSKLPQQMEGKHFRFLFMPEFNDLDVLWAALHLLGGSSVVNPCSHHRKQQVG